LGIFHNEAPIRCLSVRNNSPNLAFSGPKDEHKEVLMANPDRDNMYNTDGTKRTVYTRDSGSSTGWFVGIIVALALLAIAYLVFSANSQPSSTSTTVNNTPAVTAPAAPADNTTAPAAGNDNGAATTSPMTTAPATPAASTGGASTATSTPASTPAASAPATASSAPTATSSAAQ
jgi:hypothetical protein